MNSMKHSTLRIAFAMLFSLWLIQVSAQDFMGPLDGVLPGSGPDGVWNIQSGQTGYGIRNDRDGSAILYFYAGTEQGSEGSRRIDVDVAVDSSGQGMGGILYGLDTNTGNYYIFALETDGSVTLYRRDQDGFRMMTQTSSASIQAGSNTLTLIENGPELTYQVNGQNLGSISSDGTGRGAVGIAVAGLGESVFKRFEISNGQTSSQSLGQVPHGIPTAGQTANVRQSSGAASKLPASDSGNIEFKPIEIVDENGPFGRSVAMRTLVPADWETHGGVKWGTVQGQNACFRSQRLIWGAGSPDQSHGIAFLDPLSWGASNFGPVQSACLQQDLSTAESVARTYLQMLSPTVQSQVTDVQRPPEVDALIKTFERTSPLPRTPGSRSWYDGVAVSFSSVSEGVRNDGVMILISRHDEASAQSAMGTSQFRIGQTMMVLAITTPPGELDAGHPAFGVILNNIQPDPSWSQNMARWNASQRRVPVQPGSGTIASTGSEKSVGDMMFESWQRRNGMNNAGHQRSIDGLREVQPWQSSTGTVRLSQNYNHAWELQNGNVVLTNNANFNPMQSVNQFGQPMRRMN